jgi:hypothetical protein
MKRLPDAPEYTTTGLLVFLLLSDSHDPLLLFFSLLLPLWYVSTFRYIVSLVALRDKHMNEKGARRRAAATLPRRLALRLCNRILYY